MKTRLIVTVLIASLLVACAPTTYVYVKPNINNKPPIKKVLIMVEYLDIKNDIKGQWNFDESINLYAQDQQYLIAVEILKSKGYQIANMSLKTSGLIIDRHFLVEHYINKQRQEIPISPPYIIRSKNLQDEQIQGLEALLAEINKPMSPAMTDLRSYVKNNYQNLTALTGLPNDSAILIIQSYKPRASLFSNISVGYSSSSYGRGTSINLGGSNQRATSYAYFIHQGTGDLLWSNKTSLINTKNQQKFFEQLPINN